MLIVCASLLVTMAASSRYPMQRHNDVLLFFKRGMFEKQAKVKLRLTEAAGEPRMGSRASRERRTVRDRNGRTDRDNQ